jgi:hypothetical protein
MIAVESVSEILSVYRKHGWTLRRVLLSPDLSGRLADTLPELFDAVEIVPSTLDALWFSRGSKGTLEAWELRHLAITPYALVEVIEQDTENEAREEVFAATELRMRDAVKRKN